MTRSFVSSLGAELEAFLVFKRTLGSPYRRGEFTLRAFDRFLAAHRSSHGRVPLEKVVYDWLGREVGRKPVTVATECGVIRQFCLFRRRRHPTAFVPARSWTPQATVSEFLPHILTTAEVKALLRLAGALNRPRFRSRVYRALLLILYCTGIRFGEALRLRFCDVDLRRGVLFIAESKGRARWVPFHRSLVREIERYIVRRREYAPARLGDRLFVGLNGKHLPVSTASDTVRDLLRRAGLKPSAGRLGPRPYDLRHTFAVHRLTRWYRAGVDLHARLPWLSAYMGHDNILGTETYLTATPQLLNVASRRMRGRLLARRRWP